MQLGAVSLLRRSSPASSVLYSTNRFLRATRLNTTMAVQQPPWYLPKCKEDEPILKVYNSLTKSKVCSAGNIHIDLILKGAIDRIRRNERTSCKVVQLRADGVRRVAYGTC